MDVKTAIVNIFYEVGTAKLGRASPILYWTQKV